MNIEMVATMATVESGYNVSSLVEVTKRCDFEIWGITDIHLGTH
jgi:hypothetical protein